MITDVDTKRVPLTSVYPSLDYLVNVSKKIIADTPKLMDKLREKHRNKAVVSGLDFNLTVFSQLWGSSNTAFSDGSLSCSAMTEAYTVVVHERIMDIYFVFVDNRFCYAVQDANETFLKDFNERNLRGRLEAKKLY